jgi:hypothetical protein
MNLEKLNLVELNAQEIVEVEGGGKIKTIKKIAEKVWNWLGVADAIDEFAAGWNSVDCGCK